MYWSLVHIEAGTMTLPIICLHSYSRILLSQTLKRKADCYPVTTENAEIEVEKNTWRNREIWAFTSGRRQNLQNNQHKNSKQWTGENNALLYNKENNTLVRIRLNLDKHLRIKIGDRSLARRFDVSMTSLSSEICAMQSMSAILAGIYTNVLTNTVLQQSASI